MALTREQIEYGAIRKFFSGRKSERNWWEDICDFLSRSTMKQRNRKEIENEINENKELL